MTAREPIPAAALDDRLGFVGMTGSGKTFGAGTCVERILAKRGRVIIPDPLGVWYGLRLLPDGKTREIGKLGDMANDFVAAAERWMAEQAPPVGHPATAPTTASAGLARRQPPAMRRASSNGSAEPLPKGERACLIAMAQHPDGVTREQLTVLTGYKRSSRDAYIQRPVVVV